MGLFVLPVALLLGLAWLSATLAVAAYVWIALRRRAFSTGVRLLACLAICFVSWYLPNADGLTGRRELHRLKTDCGWSVYRRAENVTGIYVEGPDVRTAQYRALSLLKLYRTVEYLDVDRTITQLTATGNPGAPAKTTISSRTQRYGLVAERAIIGRFRRDATEIRDSETDEILARDVEYWPRKSSDPRSIVGYAAQLLVVQAGYCQSILYPDLMMRVSQVAVPERNHEVAQQSVQPDRREDAAPG